MRAAQIGIFALVYLLSALAGLWFEPTGGFATLVWTPTGLALAVLLWRGTRLWPGVALGAFAANAIKGAPIIAASGIAIGNTAEALFGFALLNRVVEIRLDFSRVKDALGLLFLAAMLSTLVAAAVGVTSLWLAGVVANEELLHVGYVWWIGDGMGALIVTPFVLTWIADHSRPHVEEIAMWAVVLVVGLVVFGDLLEPRVTRAFPYAYLVFPPLVWGAVRLGPRATATATVVLSAVAVVAATLDRGHFSGVSLEDRLFATQTYMTVVAGTGLLLSASVAERRSRDQMISVASHELRNPLAALSLHYELLSGAVKAKSSHEEIDVLMRRAHRPLERVTELVGELLDVSRAEGRALVIRREELDLAQLVAQVAARLEPEVAEHGSSLELRLEPVTGYWDRSRLDQVVTNLIGNAAKFGVGKPVTVTVSVRGKNARLVVRDRGPGIAPENRQRIFEPFVQLGSGGGQGMGLGLAIVREIAHAHGGRVWVQSELGAGCSFIVELPRAPP